MFDGREVEYINCPIFTDLHLPEEANIQQQHSPWHECSTWKLHMARKVSEETEPAGAVGKVWCLP